MQPLHMKALKFHHSVITFQTFHKQIIPSWNVKKMKCTPKTTFSVQWWYNNFGRLFVGSLTHPWTEIFNVATQTEYILAAAKWLQGLELAMIDLVRKTWFTFRNLNFYPPRFWIDSQNLFLYIKNVLVSPREISYSDGTTKGEHSCTRDLQMFLFHCSVKHN